MPATEYQGSPFSSIGRSILSIHHHRRDQVHAMDGGGGGGGDLSVDHRLEAFQRHVAEHLAVLSASGDLLSLSWIRKLLDSFVLIQEEFRAILLGSRPLLPRHPLDRLVGDYFERTVKALDVCNAVRDGIDQVRQWRNLLEIVVAALGPDQRAVIGEGQVRRAKKALTELTISMLDDKEAGAVVSHRNRSFGRTRDHHQHRGGGGSSSGSSSGHSRSLSWSVSRSWSAVRQLQAIGANLSAPRTADIVATSGLVLPIYTMNSVLLFVMWALVAAIPCQDRGLQAHFSTPRHFPWAASLSALHEKILEESRKRDRKNAAGLLKEIHCVEKLSRHLMELTDNVQSPIGEEKQSELREKATELREICNGLEEGLEPLERQVRDVFHRIVRSRTEGLDCLSHNSE